MRTQVQSLALLSGSRPAVAMSHGVGRRCGSDLKFALAVVQAGGYSSNSTSGLGTSVCHGCGPKETKRQKKKRKRNGDGEQAAGDPEGSPEERSGLEP